MNPQSISYGDFALNDFRGAVPNIGIAGQNQNFSG